MEYLLRFLVFLAKKSVAIVIIISLCVIVFLSSRGIANIIVVANDGMEARAAVVMGKADKESLYKYFSPDFIANDPLLNSAPYGQYQIVAYSYNINVLWAWAWPWSSIGEITVRESVPLEGYKLTEYQTEEELSSPDKVPAPNWQNYEYNINLTADGSGRWVITRITPIERLPDTTPRPYAR